MTNANEQEQVTLFVTHVAPNGPLLNIWAQRDKTISKEIEAIICSLKPVFLKGIGCISPGEVVPVNTLCCAYHEDNFYRARVIHHFIENNQIQVQFIDYGNIEIIYASHIRLLINSNEGLRLQNIPANVQRYAVLTIVPPAAARIWESHIINNINDQLRYKEFTANVSVFEPKHIFKLFSNYQEYFDILVQNKVAVPATREQMQMLYRQACEQNTPKHMQHHHQTTPQPISPLSTTFDSTMNNNYSNPQPNTKERTYPSVTIAKTNQQENWRQPHPNTMYSRQVPSNSLPSTPIIRNSDLDSQIENLVFKHRTLEVSGAIHEALVSDVDNDLPLKFNVQLVSCSAELDSLMRNINCHSLEPLSEPPLPGTCCLGRHSETKMLRRAVVQSVNDISKAKVYYVDFGGHDTLQHSDIFKLPREYVKPQVLSIRFTLSGLRNLIVSEEMKEYFKKLVLGKPMKLKVMPNEDSPLIRYCVLYDASGRSILEILTEMFPNACIKWPECYSLTNKSRESIHVSYIDSCSKFFVQLDKEVPLLESLADHLAECVKDAPPMKIGSIEPGVKCLAHCATDSLWYRAEVVKVQDKNVLVHYVDYGNEELLPLSSIRAVVSDLVTKTPAQAIQCILTGFENAPFDEKIVQEFEKAVLDKPLVISVLDILPKGYVVEIYDCHTKPIVNVSVLLRNAMTGKESENQNSIKTPQISQEPAAKVDDWENKSQGNSLFQSNDNNDDQASKNWKNADNEEKRFSVDDQKSDKRRNNSQSDTRFNRDNSSRNERFTIRDGQSRYDNDSSPRPRFERKNTNPRFDRNERNDSNGRYDRNESTNNRFERNDSNNRFDKNESNDRYDKDRNRERSFSRGGKGYSPNSSRTDRNSDHSWSDKDSNTSRGSGRQRGGGGGGRGGENGRGGRRDGGFNSSPRDRNRRENTGRSNYESDNGYKGNRSGGFNHSNNSNNNNKGSKFNSYDNKPKVNETSPNDTTIDTWDPIPATSTPANNLSLASNSPNIPPPNITIGAVKNCEIVFFTSPTNFYVQLSPDNLELNSVMEKISEIYTNGGEVLTESTVKVGMNCIAQYSEDKAWYRAVIQSIEPTGALVRFIDYGNTEIVNINSIKEIQDDLMKLPVQAIACKLLGAVKTEWQADEITSFERLTAAKMLEAEFVSQDQDVYNVLLREMIDGTTPTDVYINQEFCGEADLLKIKESEKNKHRIEKPKPQLVPDYAPLKQKWIEPEIIFGKEEDVTITWITDPQNFYCQFIKLQKVFETMMRDIQKSYAKKSPITDKLEEGLCIIAVFEDGAFYRAEIIKMVEPNLCMVCYVDYGNCSLVQSSKIFRVDNHLMLLPKVAVNCSFKNIVPPNGNKWLKSNSAKIDEILSVEKLQCIYHELKDGKAIVSLSNNGVDLAGVLVEKGLASFDIVPPVASPPDVAPVPSLPDVAPVPSPPEVNDNDPSVEEHIRVDISCLTGQILRVKVSNVESVNKFHIQMPSADTSEKIVFEFMQKKDPNVMLKLSQREVCLGAGCLVQTDDGWRRAVVTNCSRTTGFQVTFIDTGDVNDVLLDCMLALPSELSVMQKQAIECYYRSSAISSVETDKKLKELIEGKQVMIKIEDVESNRLVVRLYNENGEKIKLSTDEESEKICPLCPLPIFNLMQHVSVVHINHSGSVWLKRTADSELDASLLGKLFDYYSVSGRPLEIAAGKLCAALSFDGNWYRAKVIDKTDAGALVQYIDYGNTEDISVEGLKELEPQFFQPSQLAVEVSLTVALVGTEMEQQEVLNSHLLNKEFFATLYNNRNKWVAELGEKMGMKMSEEFRHLGLVVEETKKAEFDLNEPEDFVVGSTYEVVVYGTVDPTQFWVQRVKDFGAVEELQRKIQAEISTYEMMEGVPEDKLICAALYSEDQEWYRAEVIDADNEMVTVRFIDYGNTDVILGINDKIKKLPDSMKSIRNFATKCRLDIVPPGGEDWPETTCDHFAALIQSTESCKIVVVADGNPMRVELVIGDVQISEELVNKNYAVKIKANEEPIDEVFERELDPKSAFISHITSPEEFWVQEEKSVPELELLIDRFMVAEMFPKIDKIKEGDLCVARFPDDMGWYRARIISQKDSELFVHYIDYGNSSVATEIREIPADLIGIPPLSKKSRLSLPPGVEKWSEEACSEFQKISHDGATVFILDIIEEGETSTVKLTLDGEDIVNQLAPLCSTVEQTPETTTPDVEPIPEVEIIQEETIKEIEPIQSEQPAPQKEEIKINSVIEERLSPLGEENLPNVVVSHVISPAEFYVQAESQIPELESIVDHLLEAGSFLPLNSFTPGTICAAKFPEDDQWYRAEIISHSDEKTEVLYTDYGNSAVTNEFRTLPEDLIHILPLSKLCSLKMPEGIDDWSNEACVKFMELADYGATMFGCKEHGDGINPTYVSLFLNGQDIIETLLPYCKTGNTSSSFDKRIDSSDNTSGVYSGDDQNLVMNQFSESSKPSESAEWSVDEMTNNYALLSTNDAKSQIQGNEFITDVIKCTDFSEPCKDANLQDHSSQEEKIKEDPVEENVDTNSDKQLPIDLSLKSESTMTKRSTSPVSQRKSLPSISTIISSDNNLDNMSYEKNNSIDCNKSEQSHDSLINDTSDVLKGPLTPKTPLSEKLVAGVVTDHTILQAETDEILIVEIDT